MSTQRSYGFTLVELAIVMTIIGLLIGGILKGQELLENARVTSTIAQIKSYDSSVTGFRDIYDGYPGDLPNAATRIPNCNTASCGYAAGTATAGNEIVGATNWSAGWGNQAGTISTGATAQTAVAAETVLFWIHMLKANLIGGVTDTALTTATPAAWGVTHPSAKIGGGFVAGYGDSLVVPTGAPVGSVVGGMLLALTNTPTTALTSTTAGAQLLIPSRAAQMDRKMDDGVPNTGALRSWGVAASCNAGTAAPYTYLESVTTKDCSIIVRIQG